MKHVLEVLHIDDNALDRELVRISLEREPDAFRITQAGSRPEFEARLVEKTYDIVLTDYSIPGYDGLQVLSAIQVTTPQVPVVIITGTGSEEVAAEALKRGAADYLIKTSSNIQLLPYTIRSVLEKARLQREHERDALELGLRAHLLDAVGQAVVAMGPDGTVKYWNRAAEEMYGWSAQEALGRSILDLTVVPRSEAQTAEIMTRLRDGLAWSGEFEVRRRDGTTFPALVTDSPIRDETGASTGIVGVTTDITESRRVQDAERARAALAAALQDTAAVLSSTLNLDEVLERSLAHVGRVVPNDGGEILLIECERIRVAARQVPPGMVPTAAGFAPTYPFEDLPRLQQFLANDQAVSIQDTRAEVGWDEVLMGWARSAVSAPIRTRSQVIGVLSVGSLSPQGYTRSSAEHLQAFADQAAAAIENARLFRETRRRLDEISVVSEIALLGASGRPFDDTIAQATDALGRLWPQANSYGFLFADESTGVLTPHPSYRGLPAELLGAPLPLHQGLTGWVMRMGESIRAGNVREDPRYLDSGSTAASEMVAPLAEGGRTLGVINVESPQTGDFSEDDLRVLATLALQLAIVFAKVRSDAALARERDSLAQRVEERTAQLIAANTDLKKAARAKDEFFANMSHELRTPLTAILGLSEALQEGVYGPLAPKQTTSLRTIEESGRRLLALINDVLDLTKVEVGKIRLQSAPVAVKQLCQTCIRSVERAAAEKRIIILTDLASDSTAVLADERRLLQVLTNLLSNAVKFTDEEGAVGLDVHEDPIKRTVKFEVWDTGIGIADEDLSKIFQAFVQLDGSLARHYSGTGLGLALAKNLVVAQGGTIEVESGVGKGTCFTVTMPLLATPEEKSSTDEPKGALGPATALIADNSTVVGERLARLLASLQVTAVVCSPLLVHEQARAHNPDFVFIKVSDSDVRWRDALTRLKNDATTRHFPVVLVGAGNHSVENGLGRGADESVTSPISRDALESVLQKTLQSASPPSKTVPSAPTLPDDESAPAPARTPLILLADDNATSTEAIVDYLSMAGYRVITARDGFDTLAQARASAPDLILLDVQMPGLSGLEVISQVRSDPLLAQTPVISLTALAMPEDRERCLAAGATDYISKPVGLKALVTIVGRHLGQAGSRQ